MVEALRTHPSVLPTVAGVYHSTEDELAVQVDDGPLLGSARGAAEWASHRAANARQAPRARPSAALAVPAWCGQSFYYDLHDGRWPNGVYPWTYNSRSQPDSGALTAITYGFKFITDDSSACGSNFPTGATHSYRGSTTRYTWGTRDNGNVMGWAGFGPGTLALSYWWVDGSGTTVEADTAFNNRITTWSTGLSGTVPSNRYDLISVATHEAGHIFGLDHYDDVTQVMYPSLGTGENKRVKRLGDLRGMWLLY